MALIKFGRLNIIHQKLPNQTHRHLFCVYSTLAHNIPTNGLENLASLLDIEHTIIIDPNFLDQIFVIFVNLVTIKNFLPQTFLTTA